MSLEAIGAFQIEKRLIAATEQPLKEGGRAGFERFVLWSGQISGSVFQVRTVHVPRQDSFKLKSGLCVRVEGPELHRINMWLYEHGEMLGVQIHSHPTDAYHSETDDTYPIVTLVGALSIVVPDFCRRGLLTNGTATYRLRRGGWYELQPAAARRMIQIV